MVYRIYVEKRPGLSPEAGSLLGDLRNFLGLTEAIAHIAVAVADHHQGAEAETATALYHFRDPVQMHDLFNVAGVLRLLLFHNIPALVVLSTRIPDHPRGHRRQRP